MRIKSKSQLGDYILASLGSPIITIEVTPVQVSNIIDAAVQKLTEYTWGTLEDTVILQLHGKSEYKLPDTITNIINISKGSISNITNFNVNYGTGYVPNIWSDQFFTGSLTGNIVESITSISAVQSVFDKFFGQELSHNFNQNRKTLQVFEPYSGAVVVHYQYEYIADEDDDLIYNHEWLKAYTTAMTKLQWGNNIGKYDQALVGGARINYERIIQEAQTEIDRLNEELLTKWSDPAPIMIS